MGKPDKLFDVKLVLKDNRTFEETDLTETEVFQFLGQYENEEYVLLEITSDITLEVT